MAIIEEALTYDDVLLIPRYSEVAPQGSDLSVDMGRGIKLNIPIFSAAMDTVSGSRLAIALAQLGGIAIIHKNFSIAEQAEEVRRVKRFEAGIIRDPVTTTPDTTIESVLNFIKNNKFSGLPVIEEGKLVGIITQRDFRYLGDEKYVRDVMTPKEKLITAHEGASKEEIRRLLHKHRIEKLLLVDDSFALKGLVTVKDLRSTKEYPRACKDREESLRVGAAVGVGEETFERAEALVRAGVDVLVVDTAHGHSKKVLDTVRELRRQYADLLLVGGNIATAEGALDLVKAGADVVKVGIGPGSICTTRIVAGVGVPQLSAVMNVAKALEGTGKTLIADGGLRYSGDIAKAIAGGAHAVMVGSLLAGTEEAPGTVELYQGRSYKSYRGMGSLGAMNMAHGSADRYGQGGREESKRTPEGIEGRVPYRGPLAGVIDQLVGGLESSMGYVGCANLAQMRSEPDFVRISNAGMNESHVHDVTITKEPPNYRRG